MLIVILIAEKEYPVHQKLYFTSISDQMSLLKRKFYFIQHVPGRVLWLAAENTVGVLCYSLWNITMDEKHYMVHIFWKLHSIGNQNVTATIANLVLF